MESSSEVAPAKEQKPPDLSPRVCKCDGQGGERDEFGQPYCLKCGRRKALRDYREPWLSLQGAADYWGCSVRSIQYAITDGMPHATVFGKPKVLASEAEPWLIENGRLTRGGASVTVGSTANGAATATTAPPHDREVSPDGSQA